MNIKVAAFTVSEKSSNTGVYKQDNRQDNKDKIIDKITAYTLNSLPTCFFCCLLIFFEKYTIRVSNSLDPDQTQQNFGPDLGPNSLQKLSADDTTVCKELSRLQSKQNT